MGQLFPATVLLLSHLLTMFTTLAFWDLEKLQNTRNIRSETIFSRSNTEHTRSELVNRVHYIYHFGPGETQEIQDLYLLALVKEEIIWAAQLVGGVKAVGMEVAELPLAEATFPIRTLLQVPWKEGRTSQLYLKD